MLEPSDLEPRGYISNKILYDEIIRLRNKVDKLETRVSYLFGGLATLTLIVNVYEVLVRQH